MKLEDKKLDAFINNGLLPYFRKENYFRNISNKKLIKAAVKVIWPHISLYTAQEAIFEEMIRRLEVRIGLSEVVAKIMKEQALKEAGEL